MCLPAAATSCSGTCGACCRSLRLGQAGQRLRPLPWLPCLSQEGLNAPAVQRQQGVLQSCSPCSRGVAHMLCSVEGPCEAWTADDLLLLHQSHARSCSDTQPAP